MFSRLLVLVEIYKFVECKILGLNDFEKSFRVCFWINFFFAMNGLLQFSSPLERELGLFVWNLANKTLYLSSYIPTPGVLPLAYSCQWSWSTPTPPQVPSSLRAKSLQLCPTVCDPWTVAHQAPLNTDMGRPALLQGIFPDSGIESTSPLSPALAGGFFTTSATWEVH